MKHYEVILSYYLKPIKRIFCSCKDIAIQKFNEINTEIEKLDANQRRYYLLQILEKGE